MTEYRCAVPAQSKPSAPCVICGRLSPTRPLTGTSAGPAMPALCEAHWHAVQTDWLLVGWCVDHYAEALHICQVHGRMIEPL